ncbi:MAG: HAD family phosphatase [Deltaproteobacteria bacterium]|nr:HAD family phosphatase [Deltaproteobacteria bacterium]
MIPQTTGEPGRRTLYVSDLDGTLLGPEALISDFSRRHLQGMLDDGLLFTVASARSVISMRGTLGGLRLSLPVVGFNGGFVSELATGLHLEVASLDGVARGSWELARAHGLTPIVSTSDGVSEDRVWMAHDRNEGLQMYLDDRLAAEDPRIRLVDEPGAHIDERVTCLTMIDQRERLEPFERELVQRFGESIQPHLFDDLYTLGWSWLTVHAGTATKARAVRSVMSRAGLGDCRLVAFGDQGNDLPLLRDADWAVATENAAPEVKEVADEVIGHHGDDAVVKWLMERHGR